MSLIELSGVAKAFGRVGALDGIDAVVDSGSTALVGANGAGKTTLLRILLGLEAPDRGRASVVGHVLPAGAHAIRACVGYMPEGACLPSDVSAAEFVGFMAQLGGLPPRHARERTSEVLYQVGLAEERHRPIGGFSTGMKQRVKLAQALVHDPALVLLDEPTDGMDATGRSEMLDLILRVRREFGIDVLVSTHLLGDVERVCDRVIMLHAGAVLAQGAVADLKQNEQPAFELELHDNSAAVVAALERAGLGITAKGDGRLVLRGGEDVPERVRDLAAENGWPLRRLVPRAATLEQTFLQLQRIASDPITALRPRLEEVASL